GLSLRAQIAIALVRFGGGPEPRVLPHRPQPSAVHRGIDAASEWILAGIAQIALGFPIGEIAAQILRHHYRFHRQAGGRGGLSLGVIDPLLGVFNHVEESSNAPRPAKCPEREQRHHHRINRGESHNPENWMVSPLAPNRKRTINREYREQRAGGLME